MENNNTKRFIEVAIGSVSNRGVAIPPEDLYKILAKHPKQELYRSLFHLDNTAHEHFLSNSSIKNYKGEFSLDKIVFDIDKKKDSGAYVMERLQNFVIMLTEMGCDYNYIKTWFSGRGFHVEIPNLYGFEPSNDLPMTVKSTIAKDFGDMVDNIYDKGRLIRVGFSYNIKGKAYKMPLSHEEVYELGYKEIVEMASSKQFREDGYYHETIDTPIEPIWKDRQEIPTRVKIESELPKNTKYNANVTCVQKMWNHKKDERRHITLLRMINAWRRMGIPKEMSKKGAISNVSSLEPSEVDRLVDDVYAWEHQGYGCNDPIMAEFCDSVCKYYKRKNYGMDIMTAGELSNMFREFVQTDFADSSFNLKDIYNIQNDYIFMPGELIVLLGDTKLGKTAWLQNIITPLKNMRILFLSLEVNKWMIWRRFAQVANKITKAETMQIYKSDNEEMIKQIERSLEHINVLTTSPNIDSIKEIISENQPNIVVIDTLDAIEVTYDNNPLTKMDKIINTLKALANDLGIIFFGISHISKGASRDVLSIHSGKGSSAIEQKADKVIGISKPEGGDSPRRVIQSLGARDEDGFELAFLFEHNTFNFKEISC